MTEMNHKIICRCTVKKVIKSAVIFFILTGIIPPLYAIDEAGNKDIPKVFFGAGADGGYYDVNHKRGDIGWDGGYGIGGGLFFENMFNSIFGFQSGIWFTHIEMDFIMTDSGDDGSTDPSSTTDTSDKTMKAKSKSNLFTLPFYLVTSADFNWICISLLTGFSFSYLNESFLSMKDETGTERSANITQYMGHSQVGAGGGLEFKIKITKFTRIFITGTAEYYFTEVISADPEMSDHLYDYRVRAGFLLSTF